METGRRISDWLVEEPHEGSDQRVYERRAQDRRTGDRRAPKRPIDTLFAALLLNQLKPAAEPPHKPYADANRIRCGVIGDYRV
ncbi:MAG: hypothetical protein ABW199_04270 [Caulobacterales bacterium]